MAEAFSNSLTRAAGIVTTSGSGAVGVTTNLITGISTVGVATGYIVDNSNYIAGTKVTSYGSNTGEVIVENLKGLDAHSINVHMISAIQELKTQLDAAKERISQLES